MTDQASAAEFRRVPVGEIHPAEDNLRRDLGDLSDLGSVATLGVLEPLLLTPRAAGGYTLVAGHRRHAAAVAAGLAQVPAMVRPYTDDERLEVMLVENLQRRDLSPLEEALGYRRLLDLGLRQRALALRLGVSQSLISKRLALLSLPPAALEQLDSGGITVSDALELTQLVEHPERLETALSQGREWKDMAEAVREQLDQQRLQEAREASLQALRAKRVKIVEAPRWEGWYDRKEKPLDQLRLDPAEHATEKCHAAAVREDGTIIEVCRRPENHASPADIAQTATLSEAEQAERQKDKARRDAAKAREEHWRDLVARRTLRGGAIDFILRELVRCAGSHATQMAAGWLGLEPERDQWGYPRFGPALEQYIAQGPKHLQRAAFACALGQAEDAFKASWGGGSPQLRHVTVLLEATGYALTQVEIDRVTPRDDEDAAAASDGELGEDGEEEEDQENDVAQCPVCGGRGERHRRSCSTRSSHAPTDDTAADGAVGEDDQEDVARCRVCGCSEDKPCEGGCEWVEDPLDLGDLCSRCAAERGLVPENATAGEGEG
jgi:ParB/RepB/Spo0J family partition protein